MNAPDQHCLRRNCAFTLIEVLVSMLVVVIIATMLMTMTDATSKILNRTTGRIVQFQSARSAFETMTRRLSQATLNTYVDYDNATAPTSYVRQSELRFIAGKTADLLDKPTTSADATLVAMQRPGHGVFFQAPLGYVSDPTNERLRNLLNTWGYFVEFGDESASRPAFFDKISGAPPLANRYRLMELMEPTEAMGVYYFTSGQGADGKPKNLTYVTSVSPGANGFNGREWFTAPVLKGSSSQGRRPVRVIAENVLALVILPKLTTGEDATGAKLSPKYEFDSSKTDSLNSAAVDPRFNWKHQLPPVVQVTMIAVDEASYDRFQTGTNPVDLLGGRFKAVGNLSSAPDQLTDPNIYSQDLKTLETELRDKYRMNVRVFSTDVAIRAAKWSRDQAN